MTAMTKRELRAWLRSRHEGAAARNEQSRALCRHLLESEEYKRAQVIGAYMPMAREADITPVLQDAIMCGKTLALPLCGDAPHMTLRRVAALEDMVPGAYGILEPTADSPVVPVHMVDLLLVPLEGIDLSGYRLGKGGGYYDCLLADAEVMTCGCALSWQWVGQVPHDPWDKRLCTCADHRGIRRFTR